MPKRWRVIATETRKPEEKFDELEHWIRVQPTSYTQGVKPPEKGSEIAYAPPIQVPRKAS